MFRMLWLDQSLFLQELLKQITPPRGVSKKDSPPAPADKVDELIHCEGDKMVLVEKDQDLSEWDKNDKYQETIK